MAMARRISYKSCALYLLNWKAKDTRGKNRGFFAYIGFLSQKKEAETCCLVHIDRAVLSSCKHPRITGLHHVLWSYVVVQQVRPFPGPLKLTSCWLSLWVCFKTCLHRHAAKSFQHLSDVTPESQQKEGKASSPDATNQTGSQAVKSPASHQANHFNQSFLWLLCFWFDSIHQWQQTMWHCATNFSFFGENCCASGVTTHCSCTSEPQVSLTDFPHICGNKAMLSVTCHWESPVYATSLVLFCHQLLWAFHCLPPLMQKGQGKTDVTVDISSFITTASATLH